MLGTNDIKAYFRRTPLEIANGMLKLVGQVMRSVGGTPYPAPKVSIVARGEVGSIFDVNDINAAA